MAPNAMKGDVKSENGLQTDYALRRVLALNANAPLLKFRIWGRL